MDPNDEKTRKQLLRRKGCETCLQLSCFLDSDQPRDVFAEVEAIVASCVADIDVEPIKTVFVNIVRLFGGQYPGYQACNTPYHDLNHTMGTFLAMARLMHGALCRGKRIPTRWIHIGLVSALMHDTGYLQSTADHHGTGARHTATHVARSTVFLKAYVRHHPQLADLAAACEKVILCTDLSRPIETIAFQSPQQATIGKMLAAADLLSQTADRVYLEKLPLLFRELREADTRFLQNECELFMDSIRFQTYVQKRLVEELDAVNHGLKDHFRSRWGVNHDMYAVGIDRNITYLRHVIQQGVHRYRDYLRRDPAFSSICSQDRFELPCG